MPKRYSLLVNNCYYHIFSRSISRFKIFNQEQDFARFLEMIDLMRYQDFHHKYSKFQQLPGKIQGDIINHLRKDSPQSVEIIAYCIMPTHFHLIIKQNIENGISDFTGKLCNSYTKYFNSKCHRNGPLWSSRFKNVLIKNDEHMLNLTKYIHLNPTSASLTQNIEEWPYSSILDYISNKKSGLYILGDFKSIFNFTAKQYADYLKESIKYQKELSRIKYLLIDNYSG